MVSVAPIIYSKQQYSTRTCDTYLVEFIICFKTCFRSLFRTRGFTAIINDDLIEMVMSVTCLGIGVVTAFIGGLVALGQSNGSLSSVYVPVLIAFLIGLSLASTVLGVLDSAVKTCFFCYVRCIACCCCCCCCCCC